MAPLPTLHISAVEKRTSRYDGSRAAFRSAQRR